MDECRRLAREGEKATRIGDAAKGIELLESALAVGVDDLNDLPLLSAIYSQLGNAYYAQKSYSKALNFHANDLILSRAQKDSMQQAKAYSNMSATYTMLNDFEQAMSCANNVILLANKLNDKGLEARGLYNLGLAHLQNSIQGGGNTDCTEEMVLHLQEAVKCFEKHLEIAKERKDEILCGLAIGNLGNAYFYLGDYEQSIIYHLRRLEMARAVGDKSSMRRSYTNMANAYVLLGNHDEAALCYRKALALAQETNRKNLEAQLLFSLGNVEALRKNPKGAVCNYLKHLRLARALKDKAGECRAHSSLASALAQLEEIRKALYFLVLNYKIAEKLGDESMKLSTLDDIKKLIKFNPSAVISADDDRICLDASFDPDNFVDGNEMEFDSIADEDNGEVRQQRKNRLLVPSGEANSSNQGTLQQQSNSSALSMPNLSMSPSLESFIRECSARGSSSTPKKGSLIPLTCTGTVLPTPKMTVGEQSTADCSLIRVSAICKSLPEIESNEEDDFFNCLMRVQGNRINEQRADAGILKDRTNNEEMRQSDNINQRGLSATNSSGSGTSRRMSLGGLKSMGSQFRKSVMKPLSSSNLLGRGGLGQQKRPQSFYGTLPEHDQSQSKQSRKQQKLAKSKSVVVVRGQAKEDQESGSTPLFRVPQLPRQRAKTLGVASTPTDPKNSASLTGDTSSIFSSSSPTWQDPKKWRGAQQQQEYHNPETILDLIESIQSRRMDEQRADLVVLPGLNNPKQLLEKFNLGVHRHSDSEGDALQGEDLVDERLYELIVQSQADRIEDQRSELGGRPKKQSKTGSDNEEMEEEEYDDGGVSMLVERMQVGRMNGQRAHFSSPSQMQVDDNLENNSPKSRNDSPSLALA